MRIETHTRKLARPFRRHRSVEVVASAPPLEKGLARLTRRLRLGAMALAVAGCVQVDGPAAVSAPRTVTLAALPKFSVPPSASVVSALDMVRLQLIDTETDSVVASLEQAIDPRDVEWAFEVTLELLEDQVLKLRLDVELIDRDPVVDVVEFAGRTSFDVKASFEPTEIREVSLGRGPLENLSLTDLRMRNPRPRIQEGGSEALVIDTVGAQPGQIVYYESTDSAVASVDTVGQVKALAPGNALIIAYAGQLADTLNLTVGRVDLPATNVLQSRLIPQSDYVADDLFLSSLADAGAANELREGLESLVSEMLAGRGFDAVGRFEQVEKMWLEYGEGTSLRSLDGPQLWVIAITLMHAADALGIDFL